MKLYICPKCGYPTFSEAKGESFSDTVVCQSCGYQDYTYVFECDLRGEPVEKRVSVGSGDALYKEIEVVSRSLYDGQAINVVLSELSAKYNIGTETLVEIFNSFLSPSKESMYNPGYYVAIQEDKLPELIPDSMPVEAETVERTENKENDLAAVLWQERYEKSQAELARSEARYNQLLEKHRLLKEELQQLKDLYE